MLEDDPGNILAVRRSEYPDGHGNSLNTERSGKREEKRGTGAEGRLRLRGVNGVQQRC